MGLVARADEKNSYAGNFLGLLRLNRSPSHHEHESDYPQPKPFAIFDFGFWILGSRIRRAHPTSFMHLFFPNRKSAIENPKWIYWIALSARVSTFCGIVTPGC
jgi:hypothetical protein